MVIIVGKSFFLFQSSLDDRDRRAPLPRKSETETLLANQWQEWKQEWKNKNKMESVNLEWQIGDFTGCRFFLIFIFFWFSSIFFVFFTYLAEKVFSRFLNLDSKYYLKNRYSKLDTHMSQFILSFHIHFIYNDFLFFSPVYRPRQIFYHEILITTAKLCDFSKTLSFWWDIMFRRLISKFTSVLTGAARQRQAKCRDTTLHIYHFHSANATISYTTLTLSPSRLRRVQLTFFLSSVRVPGPTDADACVQQSTNWLSNLLSAMYWTSGIDCSIFQISRKRTSFGVISRCWANLDSSLFLFESVFNYYFSIFKFVSHLSSISNFSVCIFFLNFVQVLEAA